MQAQKPWHQPNRTAPCVHDGLITTKPSTLLKFNISSEGSSSDANVELRRLRLSTRNLTHCG
jgi:hypothetical protein